MKKTFFTHIFANIILAALIATVAIVGFVGVTTNVFKNDEYSPIYRGIGEKQVSLMINVYWGTEFIDDMLEIFNKYNVKTTFFVGGYWAAKYPDMLTKISSYGHEIGNHGYYHKDHAKLDFLQNAEEINACGKLVFEYVGIQPTLFAPPSGSFSSETLKAAKENGYKTIMWSRDTIDWRDKDADLIYSRATKDTSSGELVLMHPTEATAKALDRIVKYYTDNGYTVVPVSKNIGEIWTSTDSTKAD